MLLKPSSKYLLSWKVGLKGYTNYHFSGIRTKIIYRKYDQCTKEKLIGHLIYSITDQLEAPKTFGDGFAVAETLLNSIEDFELPEDCTYGQILGCRRCGVKMPQVCRSTCTASANHCLANVYDQSSLWAQWVERLVFKLSLTI